MRFLATLIASLPDGSPARTDPEMHARRLTALLPRAVASGERSINPTSSNFTGDRHGFMRYVIFYGVLTLFFLVLQWWTERPQEAAHSGAGSPPMAGTAAPEVAPARP